MDKRIVLTKRDVTRLRVLVSSAPALNTMDRDHRLDLLDELDRALIVQDDDLPSDVVAIDSEVLVRDLETNLINAYCVVVPAQADLSLGRVSVAAPLGTALIGFRTGDEVEWSMPGGTRRLRIEAVWQADRTLNDPPPQRREGLAA